MPITQSDPRAVAPQSVAAAIREGIGTLTPTERKCAGVLLANYPVAGLQTVSALAHDAGVSGPTVLRLVAKLGFGSYGEFQQRLRDELAARMRIAPADAIAAAPEADFEASAVPEGGDDVDDLLDRFRRSLVRTVDETLKSIPRATYTAIGAVLGNPRRPVTIIGGRFTSCAASQLALQLREVRRDVEQVTGPTARWPEYLIDVTRRDVFVVFDIRGYQPDVVRFAKEAARRGAEIILITDIYLSPVAAVADHVVSIRTDGLSSWESMTSLSALVETIMTYLSIARWSEIKARIERMESIRSYLEGPSDPL